MKVSEYINKVHRNFSSAFDLTNKTPTSPFLEADVGIEKAHEVRVAYPENSGLRQNDSESLELESFEEIFPENPERIGQELKQETKEAIKQHGTEAIAFYAPFHRYKHWGIRFIEERLYGEASIICEKSKTPYDKVLDSLIKAVYEHEIFHFRTEFYALVAEDKTPLNLYPKSVYLPYRRNKKNEKWHLLEEALANAHMFRLRYPRGFKNELKEMCDFSPKGYKDYKGHLNNRGHVKDESIFGFAKDVLRCSDLKKSEMGESLLNEVNEKRRSGLGPKPPLWFPKEEFLSFKITKQVPVYFRKSNAIREEERVYQRLNTIAMSELVDCIINMYDCEVIPTGTGGSHHLKIRTPKGDMIPVPPSRTVKSYFIRQIADSLGIGPREIRTNCFDT